jgi:hypothetical protein
MKHGVERLRAFVLNRATDREQEQWWLVIALAFILHVVLALPVLMPNLKAIGAADEASYIVKGRELVAGNLPALNESALSPILFALTDIPVHESDFWLIHSCTIGRFVLFVLLWVSLYMVAKRISDISSPLIMIGFLLLLPASTSLIGNGSHALFTAMSAFALAQMMSFHRRKELTSLWMASVFVSLALLSRMGEGTFLSVVFITCSILLGISTRRVSAVLAAAIIPFAVIVGGYMLIYYSFTGKSPLGTPLYFYGTFTAGHGLAYQDQLPGLNPFVEGGREADRLFGTPEQNQWSVITAIQRNPTAYLDRVPRNAKLALWTAISDYGGPLSLWFFLLALQGCIELVRQKHFMLLCILLFWPSYLLIYILLAVTPPYLLFPFPVVFCLASIGLTSVVSLPNQQRYLWSATLVGLIALAIGRDISLPFISSAVALLIGLWIVWIVSNRNRNLEIVIPAALGFLFSIMLLFREGVPPQKMRTLGIASDEQAVLFLTRNFAEGTPVAAYPAIIPWAAKMKRVSLTDSMLEIRSEQDLQRWMIDNKLEAIYVENDLRRYESSLGALIESQVGKSLEVAFSSDNPNVRVLRVTRSAKVER